MDFSIIIPTKNRMFAVNELVESIYVSSENFEKNEINKGISDMYEQIEKLLNKRVIPPILIICYNNYKYVENTINQIVKINNEYLEYIQILDNCSTCINTINYLKKVNCKVLYNNENKGPWVTSYNNKHIYDNLPDKFIITDPDLKFNENLPNNFIEILSFLSDKHKCHKIGFALDISDFDKMYQSSSYAFNKNIYEWEKEIYDYFL